MPLNYNLNKETVRRELYRLLTVVAADETIARQCDRGDPLVQLRHQFMKDELVHLLVSTAVMNRLLDDHKQLNGEEDNSSNCGKLIPDFLKRPNKNIDLSLREACNKIIHAHDIMHEGDIYYERSGIMVLPNTLILRGEQRRVHWRAFLWLRQYVSASAINFAPHDQNATDD